VGNIEKFRVSESIALYAMFIATEPNAMRPGESVRNVTMQLKIGHGFHFSGKIRSQGIFSFGETYFHLW
jgi:hypothetical protein